MAITTVLALGYPTAVVQNTEYALPACKVTVLSTAAVEHSADKTNWSALTAANTVSAPTSGGWLRCTGGAATVVCKRD